jgi:hypothetical protein
VLPRPWGPDVARRRRLGAWALVVAVLLVGMLVFAWDRLRDAYGYMKAYAIGWLLATETGRKVLKFIAYDSTLQTWFVLVVLLLLPTVAYAADASSAVVVPDASGYTWPSAMVACTYLLTSRPIRISVTHRERRDEGSDGV